jgi:Mn2+/Fe2+ NRAMP family transporter
MIALMIGIYVTIGVGSMVSNMGKWLGNSIVLSILFLPFMVVYFLVFGPKERRKEAVDVCKAIILVGLIYLVVVGFIMMVF